MKILVQNKRAHFDYEIIDKFTAGIVLLGWEVKSIQARNVSLVGAFCYFKGSELFLGNTKISEYKGSRGQMDRSRKLLLHKHELKKILKEKVTKKLTIIPLFIGQNNRKIKVEIALAKGKTKIDKRNVIKERQLKREASKFLKNYH
ncbi:SsrA-binding protein [Mesomycoplasma dispar]|uniref:SsrA-binding protein n=1 Tax=Mesomycoplasma dispar TaxID=86660 RepID=A0AAJ5TCG9_9BACT|nr:SsrA-binding protein SmpB [Mesomycoplasma dispar]AJR12120.1 single-stranded DNA-binding protein [Mesomycoplasma dispar]ATP59591.1 SsrA-binding protein SmpB [Mesomycoplasma dispar]VEU61491.1 SsrA-binding protein [Mesomycoplasma dispar]